MTDKPEETIRLIGLASFGAMGASLPACAVGWIWDSPVAVKVSATFFFCAVAAFFLAFCVAQVRVGSGE